MAGNQVLERVGPGFDYNRAAMKTPSFWLQCALIAGTVSLVGCQGAPMPEPEPTSSGPTPVGDTLTIAQATDGLYISWREHIIDGFDINGGVLVSGSDGLTGCAYQKPHPHRPSDRSPRPGAGKREPA